MGALRRRCIFCQASSNKRWRSFNIPPGSSWPREKILLTIFWLLKLHLQPERNAGDFTELTSPAKDVTSLSIRGTVFASNFRCDSTCSRFGLCTGPKRKETYM